MLPGGQMVLFCKERRVTCAVPLGPYFRRQIIAQNVFIVQPSSVRRVRVHQKIHRFHKVHWALGGDRSRNPGLGVTLLRPPVT